MTNIVCSGKEGSLHGKVKEKLQKTNEYAEMNKNFDEYKQNRITLFSLNNSGLGSIFIKTKFSQNKNVADTLVFKLTGPLISMSS